MNVETSDINGDCNQILVYTWTATDDCGNSTSVSQTITVVDNTAPVFTNAPVDITAECDGLPDPSTVTATDNCDDDVEITFEEVDNGNGTITRTWTCLLYTSPEPTRPY